MTALAVAGFVWLGVVQSAVPGIAGLTKTHFVLYFPRSSGYFYQARYEVQDTREFLAGYEDLLAQRDYLHIGTHPPGLTLLFRGLLGLLVAAPGLTDAILATEPDLTREAAATIRANELTSGRTFTRTDEACLWLAAMLAQAAAAAAVIPLFVLLAGRIDRRTAWFAAAVWPLVPGIAIFLPKSDAVFPLISVLGPCLWLVGWRQRSLVCCGLAGLTLLCGMLLSLAIAPIAVLTALATVFETGWHAPEQSEGRGQIAERLPSSPAARSLSQRIDLHWWLLSMSAAAVGFFVPCVLLWWMCDLNLPRVWSWNVANHALFYEHNPRTWWKWLLVESAGDGAGRRRTAGRRGDDWHRAQSGIAVVPARRRDGARVGPVVDQRQEHGRGGTTLVAVPAVAGRGGGQRAVLPASRRVQPGGTDGGAELRRSQ